MDVGQGTPLEVMSDQAAEGELQRQMILYQAQMKANALRQQSALDVVSGDNAERSANTQATGTLLTGFAGAVGSAAKAATGFWQASSPGTIGTGPGTGYTY